MMSRLRAGHLLWPVWLAPGWIALWLAVSVPVDGQAPVQERVETKTNDTIQATVLNGLGVFGRALGIHGQDSLVVAGDLILDRADVVGEGVLLLKSDRPQQLIARQSSLNRLAIDNPNQVALHGDLRIKKRLAVKQGTFNTTDGNLRLDPACQTELLAGGQVKAGPVVDHALPTSRWAVNYSATGLMGLTPVLPAPVSRTHERGTHAVQPALRYASLAHKKPVPPPETGTL